VSAEVADAVLGRGQTWRDRAFVVNDWYLSAYAPIADSRRCHAVHCRLVPEGPVSSPASGRVMGPRERITKPTPG
jgi:hypothetical protein